VVGGWCVQEFPSSSPYITSVGGTQLSTNSAPVCGGSTVVRGVTVGCTGTVETVCSARLGGVITSGGGFSERYPRPPYQSAQVQAYLDAPAVSKPSAGFFNPQGRGYPDISGMAASYLVQMGSKLVPESGTSASTPLWAAFVTLWNDVRLTLGMPPLGFINPLLYQVAAQHPDVFNVRVSWLCVCLCVGPMHRFAVRCVQDIVTGDNKCLVSGLDCCEQGFEAAPGWDATSGLGSPKFVELANFMINPNAQFTYAAPFVPAPPAESSRDRVELGLSIAAIVVATIAFIGFCVMRRTASRSEALLDTGRS
jgi:tripeptidyl-peptidase-1